MPTTAKNTLFGWFIRGAKPLASQFVAWFDSYWHKDETIPMVNISGLVDALNETATIAQLNALLAGIEGTFDPEAPKEIELSDGAVFAGIQLRNLSNIDPVVFFIEVMEGGVTSEYLAETTIEPSGPYQVEQTRLFGPCLITITTITGAGSFKIFK